MIVSDTISPHELSSRISPLSRLQTLWRNNKGMVFVAPAVALWLFVGLYPVVFSVVLSLHRWNGFAELNIIPTYECEAPGCRYVELRNFERFLTAGTPPNHSFVNALNNTLLVMFTVTGGVIILALPLALAMNNAMLGAKIFRTLLLFPMAASGIAIYYVWKLIYQPEGTLNSLLQGLGLNNLVVNNGWLGDINTALPAIIVVMIWGGVPFAMLLYLAGLQTIPQEVTDAATVDGAGFWVRVRHIIWPLLRPITIIILITSLSGALQGYEMPLLMTNGGPAEHTTVVGLLVYNTAFGGSGTPDLGMASAYGWALFVLGLLFSGVSLYLMRSK